MRLTAKNRDDGPVHVSATGHRIRVRGHPVHLPVVSAYDSNLLFPIVTRSIQPWFRSSSRRLYWDRMKNGSHILLGHLLLPQSVFSVPKWADNVLCGPSCQQRHSWHSSTSNSSNEGIVSHIVQGCLRTWSTHCSTTSLWCSGRCLSMEAASEFVERVHLQDHSCSQLLHYHSCLKLIEMVRRESSDLQMRKVRASTSWASF